ncbi:pilus assembly protein [Xylophilus sp. Leaf220]|uniref:pilus assembly protein n=1 Tax=Xylophilus sp. Leaf220 TaxID=1735686 RepID=UPI000700FE8F|nr:PilC/PilY family type IV pilus protein [Xylophilus sp. Leaf220]KQM80183.1 hypothetical protein ASE76_03245 [Xylophilus sp. Leaf220]
MPVITLRTVSAKPNLMFILDSSGSMAWDFMPDDMGYPDRYYGRVSMTDRIGFWSSQCNGVAYDPDYAYTPPVKADGSTYGNASFTAAWNDGYAGGAGASLAGQYYYIYKSTSPQPRMGWTYNRSSGAVVQTTTFYKECTSRFDEAPGNAVFSRVSVDSLNAAQKQNYANWYSFYRKRYLLMRTAVGKAFASLDSGYRVGFSTIKDRGVVDGQNYFQDVKDFDAGQRADFYSSLYSSTPGDGTPLRAALSKVGRYFAKTAPNQAYDPVQYSCQRNFALLSTDGYWNGDAGYKLDGTAVGNQDKKSVVPRPISEGATESSDTLADVAQYYYATDLRSAALGNCISTSSGASRDVCADNVPPSTRDPNTQQHMSTFTVGLGVGGSLAYDPDYLTQSAGSYASIVQGSLDWPTPTPGGDNALTVDDLWHTAVNGRGQYYSARSASALGAAISGIVTSVQEITGAGASAATTSMQLVGGSGNQLFQSSYRTVSWTGDVQAFALDGSSGDAAGVAQWSAQNVLAGTQPSSRRIYYRRPGSSAPLRPFTFANLDGDGLGAYFSKFCSQATVPSQCAGLSADNQTLANTGGNLVDYLRGVRTQEASNTAQPLYRTRTAVLGDIIGGAPVYMAAPPFAYADAGYTAFKSANASRKGVVYAPANDGMLHAFEASSGRELWAYVPTAVMPRLYRLADAAYGTSHQYSVDGAPVIGDVYLGGAWKTILVAGLNAGGKAYYALDITDPDNPASLWEFTDANLGLSFGNPVITKRADGTWVVAFASGYNNTGGGDGRGHLFMVDAASGAKLLDISTTAGSAGDPSGLARLNAWVDDVADNTAKRFYGGDLFGNLWRFDTDSLARPFQSALKLAEFRSASGAVQPVTTQPVTALVSSAYPVVAVGTGRYLGTSDITDATTQSIYVVKDPLVDQAWGTVRTAATANRMVQQTITAGTTTATVTSNAVNWGTHNGWWVDLPTTGERIATDMVLQSGKLVAASAIPSGDACTSGGASWLYQFNFTTGSSAAVVGQQLSTTALAVGLAPVRRSNGSVRVIVTDSQGRRTSQELQGTATGIGTPRRSSWRELVD